MHFHRLVLALAGAAVAAAELGAAPFAHLNGRSKSQFFLDDGLSPMPRGSPWGEETAELALNKRAPDTGVVRRYDWTVTRTTFAPDGVQKPALLVNGQFPGPLLEANYGDTFQITVHNQIPDEGTLLHWHGLLHQGSPWYDGVPSVDMCPIAPNTSFTYVFKADQYGTSWWHSHYTAQLADGLWGPMVIYGPKPAQYDVDLGPVSLSAHYHKDYHYYIDLILAVPAGIPFSDNNLINGKGTYPCANVTGQPCSNKQKIAQFDFKTGKTHLIRLINTSAEGTQHFTIDNHTMTIVANDYVRVKPYAAKFVTLAPGQRTDIIVKADQDPTKAYYMRANMSTICDPVKGPDAVAAIYYPKAPKNKPPTSTPTQYNVDTCTNDPLSSTVPQEPSKPPAAPATTKNIAITLGTNSSGNQLFFMNGIDFRGDYNSPVALLAKMGQTSFTGNETQWNVYNFGSNSSVRIVLTNETPLYHPMHLHGHNFWVLAEGVGAWDGTVTNADNPQRRDVQILRPGTAAAPGYLVIEFAADNPGVWPLHCHIGWHIATGLYVSVLEQPAKLQKFSVPFTIAQTCRNWAKYTNTHVVDQIDSGL